MEGFRIRAQRHIASSYGAIAARRRLARSNDLLERVKSSGRRRRGDILCIAIMRNEMLRLPDFFRHYRGLGVDRFAIVDDNSNDGTLQFALEQPDTAVYRTRDSYESGRYGAWWASWVAMREGLGHWCVIVDADEHLVYDRCEDYPLPRLTSVLAAAGRSSLCCLMVETYGAGPVEETMLCPGKPLLAVSPYFDGTGYRLCRERPRLGLLGPRHQGGPRSRQFSTPADPFRPSLAKTPLVRWTERTVLWTSHQAFPWHLNFGSPSGCLLHFKFLSDFAERALEAVNSGCHWRASREYRRYVEKCLDQPDFGLSFDGSTRYVNSRCLVRHGLMPEIAWEEEGCKREAALA
jgi:glycosyltransferase involved in cell wall biosynthesis